MVLGAITIPYLVKNTGIEAFGILTLVWTLIGYFSLFDFGLGRALTQQVASSLATNKRHKVPQLIKSGLVFTAFTGIVGGLVLVVVANPLAYEWLKVSDSLEVETAYSLLIAAMGIPLTTLTTGLRGVLEAYEDFKAVNLLRMLLGAANFGLPALSVMFFGPSLVYMVATLIAARIVVLAAHGWLVYNKLPVGWFKSKARASDIKRLLSFGAWMTVSNVLQPLLVTADRFLIAAVLGASAVAYYTVPFEVLIRVLVIPAALTTALFPRLSSKLKSDLAVVPDLYRKCMRLVVIALLPVCLVIGFGSYWGLSWWINADFAASSWLIASVLSIGVLFVGVSAVPYSMIQATGDARTTAFLQVGELFVYMPLLLFFLHAWGALGAALAWTIRAGLDLVLMLIYARKSFLRLSQQSLLIDAKRISVRY